MRVASWSVPPVVMSQVHVPSGLIGVLGLANVGLTHHPDT